MPPTRCSRLCEVKNRPHRSIAMSRPPLSESELEVLKLLWELGPSTVRDLKAQLSSRGRRWAYTTILTLVTRLQAKGYVDSERDQTAYVFRPLVSREDLLQQRLHRLSDELG